MSQYAEAPPALPSSPSSDSGTGASMLSLLVLFIVLISILSDEPRRRRRQAERSAKPIRMAAETLQANDHGYRGGEDHEGQLWIEERSEQPTDYLGQASDEQSHSYLERP